MDDSPDGLSAAQMRPGKLPPLRLWVGYLLGFATIVAEFVAAALHPEMARPNFQFLPCIVFLVMFVGGVYWLVCVYRYHVVMARARLEAPDFAGAGRWLPFHSIYNLYWVFKWPQEIARFVNWRFAQR